MTKQCLFCGLKFHTIPSRVKQGFGKYCSQKCYWKSLEGKKLSEERKKNIGKGNKGKTKHPLTEKTKKKIRDSLRIGKFIKCKLCEKEFYVNPSMIKRERKYCSIKCAAKGREYQPTQEELSARKKKYSIRKKDWIKNNLEKFRSIQKRYKDKIYKTPEGNLNHRMGVAIQNSLKKEKAGRKWETLVGYTLQDLMQHLEKQFEPWMNWNNYGRWHIDHRTPKSWFNYTTAEDKEFELCWALKNLQPMEKIANIKKGNRWMS